MVLLTLRSEVARELDMAATSARQIFERNITEVADLSSLQLLLLMQLRKSKALSGEEARTYVGLSTEEFDELLAPLKQQKRIAVLTGLQRGFITLTTHGE